MPVSWSRRRVLTDGALSLAAALSLPRAMAGNRTGLPLRPGPMPASTAAPSASPAVASSAAEDSGALRSATGLGGRLTTGVTINGSGPFRFMVDTGSERTVIADDLAARLALPHGAEVMVQGIVRGQPASLVEIGALEMGSLVCSRLQVPTLPRDMLQADGYLGLDVLDGRRVIFDFSAGTLTIKRPQGVFSAFWTRWNRDEVSVPTLGDSGRLRATDCLIDGVAAAAFVDTGAQVSIINQELYAALQQRRSLPATSHAETLTGVTGGTLVGMTTVLDKVRLGHLALTFTLAIVADLPVFRLWGLDQQPALLIGMDCLRHCARFSIDYGRKELHFEVARSQLPRPLEARLPGPLEA